MTGFIKKLFGSKPQNSEPSIEVIKPARVERGNAYYLDADAAKTFGNLDYMRASKTVRHTMPKGKVGKDNAYVRVISASEATSLNGSIPQAPLTAKGANQPVNPSTSQSVSLDASTRRRPDSSMDMFRNMARDIKKG